MQLTKRSYFVDIIDSLQTEQANTVVHDEGLRRLNGNDQTENGRELFQKRIYLRK